MLSGSALQVRGLSVTVRRGRERSLVLDGLSLAVDAGQCLGVVGESGCGKSIALRSVMGLLPAGADAVAGTVQVAGGRPWLAGQGVPADVSMVFQDSAAALDPTMRIGAFVAETARRHRALSWSAAWSRTLALLADVGITDPVRCARAYPHELSGGMRQRAALALALAAEPRVLLCDEPTTALDVTLQAKILSLFRRKQAEEELGLVFVSHDLAVVGQVADIVAVMYAGRIVEIGPATEVIGAPRHPYTQALVASSPDLDMPRQRFVSIGGAPPDPADYEPGCRFVSRCSRSLPGPACVAPRRGLDGGDTSHRSDCVHERPDAGHSVTGTSNPPHLRMESS